MRVYEKIILCLVGLGLFSGLFHFADQDLKLGLMVICMAVPILSYLFAGYWILRDREKKQIILPIFAGIAYSSSLLVLFMLLVTIANPLRAEYFLIPNHLLFPGLGIYLLIKSGKGTATKNIKGLFIRSLVLFIPTTFLTFTPDTNPIHRRILLVYNNDSILPYTIEKDRYQELFNEAYNENDCDKELVYAEKANLYGKLENDIDTAHPHYTFTAVHPGGDTLKKEIIMPDTLKKLTGFSMDDMMSDDSNSVNAIIDNAGYQNIQNTFEDICIASKCKAEAYFKGGNYLAAFAYYNKLKKNLAYMTNDTAFVKLWQDYANGGMKSCEYRMNGQGAK